MTQDDRKTPETEVPEKAERRRFSMGYKLEVLRRVEACRQPGEVGALLRAEGLYSSHLVLWRRQLSSRTRISPSVRTGISPPPGVM